VVRLARQRPCRLLLPGEVRGRRCNGLVSRTSERKARAKIRDPGAARRAALKRQCGASQLLRWVPGLVPLRCTRPGHERVYIASSSLRSRHCGFISSMSASFQARSQRFKARSRARASRIDGYSSKYTSLSTLYFRVSRGRVCSCARSFGERDHWLRRHRAFRCVDLQGCTRKKSGSCVVERLNGEAADHTSCPGRVQRSGTRHRSRVYPRSALICASRVYPTCVDPAQELRSAALSFSRPHTLSVKRHVVRPLGPGSSLAHASRVYATCAS
jgi:hypothetical protein